MSIEVTVQLPLSEQVDPRIEHLKPHVQAYLRKLRFQDPELLEALTRECLRRAGLRTGRQDLESLLRRACEEAQRRLDRALAEALGLHLPREAALVAAARAALLITSAPVCADDLIRPSPRREELLASLKARLPVATPPEAPAPMPTQVLEFWL